MPASEVSRVCTEAASPVKRCSEETRHSAAALLPHQEARAALRLVQLMERLLQLLVLPGAGTLGAGSRGIGALHQHRSWHHRSWHHHHRSWHHRSWHHRSWHHWSWHRSRYRSWHRGARIWHRSWHHGAGIAERASRGAGIAELASWSWRCGAGVVELALRRASHSCASRPWASSIMSLRRHRPTQEPSLCQRWEHARRPRGPRRRA